MVTLKGHFREIRRADIKKKMAADEKAGCKTV